MKKGFTVLISLCFCLFTLAACGAKGIHAQVSEELGIDVSKGREISNYDSHGGFHGDGTTCIVFEFDDDTVLEEVKNNPAWKAFPLDETVQTLVYGAADENGQIGPYLTKDSEGDELHTELLVPEIQNGYYLLVDVRRNPEWRQERISCIEAALILRWDCTIPIRIHCIFVSWIHRKNFIIRYILLMRKIMRKNSGMSG